MLSVVFFLWHFVNQEQQNSARNTQQDVFTWKTPRTSKEICSTRKCCKIPLIPQTRVITSQFHQKSSTVNPALSRARQYKVCMAWSPNLLPKERAGKRKSVRKCKNKPQYLCTVYEVEEVWQRYFAFKMNFFPPWHSFCLRFLGFIYC